MINKLRKSIKSGFTLVELLAVIVILAIILVIAVPKIMNIINDTKKSTFASSVKLIASSAEQRYAENKVLGNTNEITCKDVAKLNSSDYKLCEITFEQEEARVTVAGDGKFDRLSIVYASKTNAEVQEGEPERLYTFDDVYSLNDELKNELNTYKERVEELENNNSGSSDTIENLQNKIAEHDNKINSNATSISNLTNKENANNIFYKHIQ